ELEPRAERQLPVFVLPDVLREAERHLPRELHRRSRRARSAPPDLALLRRERRLQPDPPPDRQAHPQRPGDDSVSGDRRRHRAGSGTALHGGRDRTDRDGRVPVRGLLPHEQGSLGGAGARVLPGRPRPVGGARHPVTRLLRALDAFWFPPAPAARLAVLRILVGAFALWLVGSHYAMWVEIGRSSPTLFAPVGPVARLRHPLSPELNQGVIVATVVANVLFVLGWRPRFTG